MVSPLWQTLFTTSIGFPVPLITALPNVTCGCRRFALDSFGDHVSTCESHSGALKAHDWAVAQLAPIFRSAGHSVKCQYKVAPSQGKKRGDLEIVGYLRDATGPRNLVIDLNITHDRHGRSIANPHTNGHLTHPNSLDQPLETAARAKITKHQAAYSNNNSTSFLPGVASTSGRLHCELLRSLPTGSSGNRGILPPFRRASANQPGFFPIQTRGILLWHQRESGSHLREGCCPAHQHQHRRQPSRHGPHTHHTYIARFSPPLLLPFSSPPPSPPP